MDKSGILVQFVGPRGGKGRRRKFTGKDVPRLAGFIARLMGLGRSVPRRHDLTPGRVRDGQRTWRCSRCKRVTDPVPEGYSRFQADLTVAVRPEEWPAHCGTGLDGSPFDPAPEGTCCPEMDAQLGRQTVYERDGGFQVARSHGQDPMGITNCPWCGSRLAAWSGMRPREGPRLAG